MTVQDKSLITLVLTVFGTGVLMGYLLFKNINHTETTTSTTSNIQSSTTSSTVNAPPINANIPAKVDTVWKTRTVSDTVYIDKEIEDIVAKGDTTLEDSSYIGAEYSYMQQRFKFEAQLKQKIVTNTIKETVTVTNTVKESGGLLFFQIGGGLVITQEKASPGIYIGIGYSTKIF